MLSQLYVLATLAGVMALPKIEHRAESGQSGSDWSKYYEKLQDYVKNNQAVNKPESPISQGQIQSDSQYPYMPSMPSMPNTPDYSNYQNQMQGYGQQMGNQEQYSEYFKKCMGSYNFQNPIQGEGGATSASSGSDYSQQWNEQWKSCSQNWSNIPGSNNFNNGLPHLPGASSSATSG